MRELAVGALLVAVGAAVLATAADDIQRGDVVLAAGKAQQLGTPTNLASSGRRMLSKMPAAEAVLDSVDDPDGGSAHLSSSAKRTLKDLSFTDQCYSTFCTIPGPGSACTQYSIPVPVGYCTCSTIENLCISSIRGGYCLIDITYRVICPADPGASNDPVINGFNGAVFKFEEVGEYTFFEAEGFRVDTTFLPALAEPGEGELRDKSFTSAVRIFAPNGDHVTCKLPAIRPASLTPEVTVEEAATGQVTKLSPIMRSAQLAEMRVEAKLSEGEGVHVTGCQVLMPHAEVIAYQVLGSQQAQQHPDEAWAAPFTWLNIVFRLTHRLEGPVSGILGATYPADGGDPQGRSRQAAAEAAVDALRVESTDPTTAVAATIDGGRSLAPGLRRLLATPGLEPGVLMVATIGSV